MLKLFNERWDRVPTVWIDTETTGTQPGFDRAVQVGIVRFEGGKPVGTFEALCDPGMPIPAEASEIHGITNDMLDTADAPRIELVFAEPEVVRLLEGAQPAAYNAGFDRHFVPPEAFEDWTWPWLDSLSLVRVVDRYVRGKGRHQLKTACARHGVRLEGAHTAAQDACAAGELFYRLAPDLVAAERLDDHDRNCTLGSLLRWQRQQEANEWWRFNDWLSRQPPREEQANG